MLKNYKNVLLNYKYKSLLYNKDVMQRRTDINILRYVSQFIKLNSL